jgi:phage-related protein (TIGR01555 family)
MDEQNITINAQTLQVLASVLMQRDKIAARLGKSFNSHRKMYEVLGYKKKLDFNDYLAVYERQDIAARIVDAPPATTWKNRPEVKEDDNGDTETAFEKAWKELVPPVEIDKNGKEKVNIYDRLKVFHYLERIDKLSGVGRFGILLIGVRGGTSLDQPVEDGSLKSPKDILYLSPFMEGSVEITEWENDPSNERFGKPNMYRIDMSSDIASTDFKLNKVSVHYSRVLHIAENLMEDEIFGEPRLKKVYNRLQDLEKVAGGGAEMFWQGAYGGLHATTRDGYQLSPGTIEAENIKTQIEEYIHGLRRAVTTNGMEINRIGVELKDPKNIFDILISLISGAKRIPKRILIGSERGELASIQDEDNWFGYIKERQTNYADPMILRSFIDWCIRKGALPVPKNGYTIKWPPLYEMSDKDKSEIGLNKARTIKEYAPPGASDIIVPVGEFREKILGLDAEPDEKYQNNSIEEDLDEKEEEAQEQFKQVKDSQNSKNKDISANETLLIKIKKLLGIK